MALKTRNSITEIYGTVQGEGRYIGRPQIFIRMYGCEIGCTYCDTPDSLFDPEFALVELDVNSDVFEKYPNPLSKEKVLEICNAISANMPTDVISLTGGEPLESADYLTELLPYLRANGKYKILLETGGIHYTAFEKIADNVDIISMDIKLASTSGLINPLPAHARFIESVKKHNKLDNLYVKFIINEGSTIEEMDAATKIIPKDTPVIIQPQTDDNGLVNKNISDNAFLLYKHMLKSISAVSFIPQMHKFLNLK